MDLPGRIQSVQGISYKRLIQILLSACILLFRSFLWPSLTFVTEAGALSAAPLAGLVKAPECTGFSFYARVKKFYIICFYILSGKRKFEI